MVGTVATEPVGPKQGILAASAAAVRAYPFIVKSLSVLNLSGIPDQHSPCTDCAGTLIRDSDKRVQAHFELMTVGVCTRYSNYTNTYKI